MPMKEVDCRGLACPGPVVACSRVVKQETPSALCVLVDNPAAVENVSRFLRTSGYTVSNERKEEALWQIQASREAVGTSEAASVPQASAPSTRGKTLVLITTETLGRGDEALGAKLMDNFLATLPELGDALWRIVLLNGGVRLAARPGKALDSLKALEAAGVSILVCGTCLDYYQLLEKRAVGQTTNMLDVVSSLALADKVIRP
ncbi:sulfurtransferase-like selenium metabolism protein YedF [uncultured Desulfovibrio sp.]|uniref:sulfurtransferase-like selenium metabolism protein YedF n=1 Tax=uncultured Desulfovibrio sp. TaxID=167968 RepID=UPI002634B558|nr:sulfurtransferase-like selenium metabolism protein YedF [uncultured Desulfovibrio sp.]